MLKRCNISWLMSYEKEGACTNYFIILRKKRFSREHTKNPNANVRVRPDLPFWLWDIIPPESHLAFHTHYIKYENTLTCKRISWDSGGWCFKIIFSISYMYNTKSDHFVPKIKLFIYGKRKPNAKLYNRNQQPAYIWNGSIWSTLIVIKIMCSDTLWFP